MSVGLAISLGIFGLIAVREWLPEWLKIWHIMLVGAGVMLLAGEISPRDALAAVDWNIIAYLFAVFSIGTSLYLNGVSHRIADRLVGLGSAKAALAAFIVCFAVVAAIVTNDAAAIIGAPIAFVLAARTGVDPKTFLIALCVTVTVGSMATPIGNPQNLLIAESGDLPAPLFTFLAWLIVPTVISLAMAAWWFSYSLKSDGSSSGAVAERASVSESDKKLWPSLIAVGLLGVLVTADSVMSVFDPKSGIPLGLAACVACIPVYAFDRRRKQTFLGLDWPTLVFFVAMFIVTGALLTSGSLHRLLGDVRAQMTDPLVTAAIGFFGSQIFSNVPLVDMYLKVADSYSTDSLIMLAASSTLAGNVFIIGAASNVIVLQQSEAFGGPSITFTEFFRAVLPVGAFSTIFTLGWVYAVSWVLASWA
ncbi:MAG: SLC13 family permease [Rhodoplanes sp.]